METEANTQRKEVTRYSAAVDSAAFPTAILGNDAPRALTSDRLV